MWEYSTIYYTIFMWVSKHVHRDIINVQIDNFGVVQGGLQLIEKTALEFGVVGLRVIVLLLYAHTAEHVVDAAHRDLHR